MSFDYEEYDEDDEDDDDIPAIIVDNGTCEIKAGFAGDDAPRVLMSTIVGHHRQQTSEGEHRECFVGEECRAKRDALNLSYPIERGIITNWEDMENIWNYVFDQLNIIHERHPILLTEPPLNPKVNKEKMAQVMFETFGFSAIYIAIPSIISLYSVGGRTTGVIVDIGEGVTHIIPHYEGHIVSHAITRFDYAGRDLSDYMMVLLSERNYSFSTASDREVVREMKEKHCYVSLNYKEELITSSRKSNIEKVYQLPDGQGIAIGQERFTCPEVLFQPSMMGVKGPGIHEAIDQCIMECDVDLHKDLYNNIVLTGGSSLLPGLPERLEEELSHLNLNPSWIKRIIAPPERKYSAWFGGAVLADLSTFQTMWISRSDYEEYGPTVVHRKTFQS